MNQKRFSGKAIYQPSGKAAEYSPWACNFFTGCSNDCEYCYCKRGVLNHVWDNRPHLKRRFVTEHNAFDVFCKELDVCQELIGEAGLLFSFTTDPLLPETRSLTFRAMEEAISRGINVKILTKRADWIDEFIRRTEIQTINYGENKRHIAFGFTLTGFDEKEPFASLNSERIEVMRELHDMGFKTFASIEPIITPAMSRRMIEATLGACDLYKVGLMSGVKKDFYEPVHLSVFWEWLKDLTRDEYKIYPKDSLLNYFNEDRSTLEGYFVDSTYNMFD